MKVIPDVPDPEEPFTWSDEPLDEYVLSLALTQLSDTLHATSVRKGFYEGSNVEDKTYLASKVALIHSEASELLEAYRSDPLGGSDKVPELTSEEEELADIIIRALDLAAFRGVAIGSAVLRKAEYNRGRAYKHGKNL